MENEELSGSNHPCTLPSSILSQLNEFSHGGFILITSLNGEPQIYSQTDNIINEIALRRYAQLWLKAADTLNTECIEERMLPFDEEEEEEDFPEDLQ